MQCGYSLDAESNSASNELSQSKFELKHMGMCRKYEHKKYFSKIDLQCSHEYQCIHHHVKHYLITCDTFYPQGVDSILRRCLIHEESKRVLNGCNGGACGRHLLGLERTQNILCACYFWPSIFKVCVEAVKECHPCQMFTREMIAHLAPLYHVIIVGPFTK